MSSERRRGVQQGRALVALVRMLVVLAVLAVLALVALGVVAVLVGAPGQARHPDSQSVVLARRAPRAL